MRRCFLLLFVVSIVLVVDARKTWVPPLEGIESRSCSPRIYVQVEQEGRKNHQTLRVVVAGTCWQDSVNPGAVFCLRIDGIFSGCQNLITGRNHYGEQYIRLVFLSPRLEDGEHLVNVGARRLEADATYEADLEVITYDERVFQIKEGSVVPISSRPSEREIAPLSFGGPAYDRGIAEKNMHITKRALDPLQPYFDADDAAISRAFYSIPTFLKSVAVRRREERLSPVVEEKDIVPSPAASSPSMMATATTLSSSSSSHCSRCSHFPENWDEEKYMMYWPFYGRFNNQRRYLYAALNMAAALNRTLILPRLLITPPATLGLFGRYFDLDLLRSKFRVEERNESILPPGYSIYYVSSEMMEGVFSYGDSLVANWYTRDSLIREFGHLPHKVLMFDILLDKWDFGEQKYSGLSQEWAASDALLFGIPRSTLRNRIWTTRNYGVEHYEAMLSEEYLATRSVVRFKEIFVDKAKDIIRLDIGNNNRFLAVHIRLDTDKDAPREDHQKRCPTCCVGSLSYTLSRITQLLYSHNISTVFIASEGAYDVENELELLGFQVVTLESTTAVLFEGMRDESNSVYDPNVAAIVEQMVQARADLWIGSLCSTLSIAAYEERILLGKPEWSSYWW